MRCAPPVDIASIMTTVVILVFSIIALFRLGRRARATLNHHIVDRLDLLFHTGLQKVAIGAAPSRLLLQFLLQLGVIHHSTIFFRPCCCNLYGVCIVLVRIARSSLRHGSILRSFLDVCMGAARSRGCGCRADSFDYVCSSYGRSPIIDMMVGSRGARSRPPVRKKTLLVLSLNGLHLRLLML